MPLGLFHSECGSEIQFLTDSPFNYECTITFNPTLYTVSSAYNEGVKSVEEALVKWLEPTTTEYLLMVMEYQKSHMVHLHCLISSTHDLPISLRANILKGLQRIAGRSTFKPVIDLQKYLFYVSKDLELNFVKSNIPHYKIYYR